MPAAVHPIFEVARNILDVIRPSQVSVGEFTREKPVTLFSNVTHFTELWKLIESRPEWLRSDLGERTIVLTWEGWPDSGEPTINVTDHLTPLDWVVALSSGLLLERRDEQGHIDQNTLPQLRILILDLTSQRHTNAHSVRLFSIASRALPWVHCYGPVSNDIHRDTRIALDFPELRSALPPDAFNFEDFGRDVLDLNRMRSLAGQSGDRSLAEVDILMASMRTNLIRPGDRHYIANLIGPLVLAESMENPLRDGVLKKLEDGRPLRGAIRTLMGALGLKERRSTTDLPQHGLLAELENDPDPFERRNTIRFGLVDDQYARGFHQILSTVLFGQDYRRQKISDRWIASHAPTVARHPIKPWTFECWATVDGLVARLDALEPPTDWACPRFLELDCDILLLDLRVWQTGEQRREFFTKVVATTLRLGNGVCPTNDSRLQRAFKAAQDLLPPNQSTRKGQYAPAEIDALALLPLLISHYDPSLPIVLFSSTHQRSVLELVSHRPNILTDFAKPIFSGYGEDASGSSALEELGDTLRQAIRLHEARVVWSRIEGVEWHRDPPDFYTWRESAAGEEYKTTFNDGLGPTSHASPSGNALKTRLADLYTRYVVAGHPFDFASVPYEVIEGALTSPLLKHAPDPIKACNLDQRRPRNKAAHSLELARNRKAHGQLQPPVKDEELQTWHWASLLLFSVLLDFITGAVIVDGSAKSDLADIESKVKRKLRVERIFTPRLTSFPEIPWVSFVVTCVAHDLEKSCSGTSLHASSSTVTAVRRLSGYLLSP